MCESVCVQLGSSAKLQIRHCISVKPGWPRTGNAQTGSDVSTETLSHFRKETLRLAGVYNHGYCHKVLPILFLKQIQTSVNASNVASDEKPIYFYYHKKKNIYSLVRRKKKPVLSSV